MLKILQARLQQYENRELPDFKLDLEKAEESESNCQQPLDHWKSKRVPKKTYFCFIEMGIPDHLTCLLRHLYAGQVATVRTGHVTTDWFQIGKGVVKAVYCHPAYLTYVQSTPCQMPDWMKHKLESRLLGEMSTSSDMQMIPPLWQKVKRK